MPAYDIKHAEEKVISKISVYSNFPCSSLHDYVHWHCSIDYCVKINSRTRTREFMLKMALIIHKDIISAKICLAKGRPYFLMEGYKYMQKFQILKILRAPCI